METLTAGRELDALVAEKVMGLVPCSNPIGLCEGVILTPCLCWGTGGPGGELNLYSTDISAAWEAVNQLRGSGYDIEVQGYDASHVPTWECLIGGEHRGYREEWGAHAESAPLAICLAALKVKESR